MITELILVDDDRILLVILEKMIRIVNPDLKLASFVSGQAAMNHLSDTPAPHTTRHVLLDINLTDMNAWHFIENLDPRIQASTKFILMTSSVSSANSEKAKNYEQVVAFFEKPVTFENIHHILNLTK